MAAFGIGGQVAQHRQRNIAHALETLRPESAVEPDGVHAGRADSGLGAGGEISHRNAALDLIGNHAELSIVCGCGIKQADKRFV